jgi:hypothetical protein
MMTAHRILGPMMALMIAASTSAHSPPSPTTAVTIVLVHGALIDGSSWRGVYDMLTRDGYRVSIVQQPLTGLDDDVAALQPDVGETSAEVAPPMKPASNDLKPTKDGFIFLDPAKFAADFGADLPKAKAEFMARSQMPVSGAAFNTKLTSAAWHDKPSYAVIATEDRAFNPEIAGRWPGAPDQR